MTIGIAATVREGDQSLDVIAIFFAIASIVIFFTGCVEYCLRIFRTLFNRREDYLDDATTGANNDTVTETGNDAMPPVVDMDRYFDNTDYNEPTSYHQWFDSSDEIVFSRPPKSDPIPIPTRRQVDPFDGCRFAAPDNQQRLERNTKHASAMPPVVDVERYFDNTDYNEPTSSDLWFDSSDEIAFSRPPKRDPSTPDKVLLDC